MKLVVSTIWICSYLPSTHSSVLVIFFPMALLTCPSISLHFEVSSRESRSHITHFQVGSVAVFVTRHRQLVGGGKEELQHIVRVIVLNMVIGLLSQGIDNWGHLGGLVGGVAASWLVGPAWKYESTSSDGRRIFADRAPIFSLIKMKRETKRFY